LHGVTFEPWADLSGIRAFLLIDDVLDTGVTIAAMINAIQKTANRPLRYGVACPLWITHRIE
jgi:adenine/guanine phosphoribosyltransferase-like PRPP-binding protein